MEAIKKHLRAAQDSLWAAAKEFENIEARGNETRRTLWLVRHSMMLVNEAMEWVREEGR